MLDALISFSISLLILRLSLFSAGEEILSKVECSIERCLRRSARLSSSQSETNSSFSKASLQLRNLESPEKGSFKAISPKTSILKSRSSRESKAEPVSFSLHEDGDKVSMSIEYYDTDLFGERHLRRSPRLISATENNGIDKPKKKYDVDILNKNHLRRSPRLYSSLTQADNIKLDSTFIGFSRLDEPPSQMSIPSTGKSDLDEKCLRQSLKVATSLFEDENGKRECSFIDLPESGEKRSSKRSKSKASLEDKLKDKNISSFVGDPIPDDEAQERWRWRYEMKVVI
uniref:Uncharacterized protein n=1 Tax=Fagus sylvatica TaxID=28930 RepID=A0A2N9FFG1_FAGSY